MDRDFAFAQPLGSAAATSTDGALVERVYQQRSPFGDFLVTYIETAADEATAPVSELVGEWLDPAITKHRQGLAFAFPIRAGQGDALRQFCDEAFHHRRYEHHLSRRALGLTRERIYVNQTAAGDVATFYVEGDHPRSAYEQLAASQAVHDVWFKERCREIFADGCDLDQPLPLIEVVTDRIPA